MNIVFFEKSAYSFEALRALGAVSFGGGEVGEVLTALERIKEGDDEGWYASWKKLGDLVAAQAADFAQAGDGVSAQECYFRASAYYRSAEFFIHGDTSDPRINATWRLSRDCFLKGAAYSGPLIKAVQIPYEGRYLSGYYCRPDTKERRRPLVIVHTGYDGTAEELYFTNAVAALKRGFNVLIFDGPGQGAAIHEDKLPFRPDWEKVVTPVVDFAFTLPEVDTARMALFGISFGGYLAPHAAAYEHRIAALIADSPIFDWHSVMLSLLPKGLEEGLDNPKACAHIDSSIYEQLKTDIYLRWGVNEGLYKFGAKTPSEYLRMTRRYSNREIASRILCPTLFVGSEGDFMVHGDRPDFFESLSCPKTFMVFTSDWGAQAHCQEGSMAIANERILNWLMQTFKMLLSTKTTVSSSTQGPALPQEQTVEFGAA